MSIKSRLKSIMPPFAWGMLVGTKGAFLRVIHAISESLCLGILRAIQVQDAVKIIERLSFFAPLDYRSGQVVFEVSTYGEFKRATRACTKEPGTVKWIEDRVRPDDVFFDVGANVGAYSFVADVVADGTAKVFAFEPSYASFASLCNNIHLNRCQDRIIPLQIALSDNTSLLSFKYSSLKPGAAFHSVGDSIDDKAPVMVWGWDQETLDQRGLDGFSLEHAAVYQPVLTQPTLAYRLDDLIEQFNLPFPNVVKIDVDGAELKVLNGAVRAFMSPQLRSVLVEVEPSQSDQVIIWMAARGLSVSYQARTGAYVNFIFDRLCDTSLGACVSDSQRMQNAFDPS